VGVEGEDRVDKRTKPMEKVSVLGSAGTPHFTYWNFDKDSEEEINSGISSNIILKERTPVL